MADLSAEQFAQRAFDLNLVTDRQLQEIRGQVGSRQVSREELQQILLRREFLTNYQAERLLRGERTGYFYGDYKVLYLVGSGTFARVYRAVHGDNPNDVVALKVLRRRFAEDPEQADRFYREGIMGATLRHSNIVPIREVSSPQGAAHFLVMDFIEGRNLREFIKIRKKFEPAEATRLIIDVCSGLAYAFERGICHRDLKLSNVLVSSRGQAMLVDFGLAAADPNVSDDAMANSPNPRTIDYAALERATGVRKDDQRSDLYFLGAIFYHILTGTPPLIETRDRIQRLARTRFLDAVPIHQLDGSIPRCVTTVVNRAMELNPADRYQSPAEMLIDLKIAARKLTEQEGGAGDASDSRSTPAKSATEAPAGSQKTLMFIESNVSFQDIIRAKLKSWGYRVLVMRDPERALSRFSEDPHSADCVIFSAGELGDTALEAFNNFGTNEATRNVPAVLLLTAKQQKLKPQAKSSNNRVVVPISIKRGEFRELLARLSAVDHDQKSKGAATA